MKLMTGKIRKYHPIHLQVLVIALMALMVAACEESLKTVTLPDPSTLIPELTQTDMLDAYSSTKTPTGEVVTDEKLQIVTYLVKEEDSVFSIADQFSLNPETILWANEEILSDNPHSIKPGMELIILPVDGIYYQWEIGDTLDSVAKRFSVSPAEILNWPGNDFCGLQFKDNMELEIPEGMYIVIPDGKRFSE